MWPNAGERLQIKMVWGAYLDRPHVHTAGQVEVAVEQVTMPDKKKTIEESDQDNCNCMTVSAMEMAQRLPQGTESTSGQA